MRKIIFCIIFFFTPFMVLSQPFIEWQKRYGGTNSEYAYSVEQTNDGGYIAVGSSFSNDGDVTNHHGSSTTFDYWVIKIDSSGLLQWQKSLGGTLNDEARGVKQTPDGSYIIVGSSFSANGDVTGHHGTTTHDDYWI